MLKTQRPTNSNRQSRSRVDFKISNLQALQVPKGWDRLYVTIIHVETGRTVAKLGKAIVRNGGCQWIDTISESISITRDDSSKEYEGCLVKLILSMGSTRSSILGEANINLGQFASSRVPSAVSQPLKKCIYGTILQLKIQCVIPRSKTGDEESKSLSFREKDRHLLNHEVETNLHTSDNSSESTPRAADRAVISSPRELDSKETSQTSSIESMEGSMLNENLSTKRAFESEKCKLLENQAESIYNNVASSKNHLEASERTAEAKMWERNARKLMVDLDLSRKELSDVLKKHSELTIELSAARAEHDSLNREVEKLKLELKKSTENQCTRDMIAKSENLSQMQKVLEDEMKYQQDLNENIGHQLKRSQESNVELVSVLQELEQTIEQQRIEIEKLSSLKKLEADFKLLEQVLRDKTDDLDNERRSNRENLLLLEKDFEFKLSAKEEEIASLEATLSGYVKGDHFEALDDNNVSNLDVVRENEMLRGKIRELEKDCGELTDENLELLFKLKDLNKIAGIEKCSSFDSISSEHPPTVCPSDESEASDVKFQLSIKTELQKNLEALERKKNDLERDLSGMQQENVRLWENVSGLESQITQLKDESLKEREHSKSLAKSLKDDIGKLKRKSEDLESQLSRAREECEYLKEENINLQNFNMKASHEISHLIDDKSKLHDSLKEARSKAELIEDNLKAAVGEYELKVEDLTGQLASSEQSHKNLVAEHERYLQLLENYKISEEKMKIELNELESNRTLKAQMQDEISILKDELERCKADKGKLERALKMVSGDLEEFEAENVLLREKVSIFQDAISDFDECKRSTLVIEEKLRQVETAKEMVSIKNEELHNELSNIKEENEQFRMKLHSLEEENIEILKKTRALEEELKLMKERDNNKLHKEGTKSRNSAGQKYHSVSSKKPSTNCEVVTKERYERTKSSLETELRELKERYLQMSLKYAEVESEREDLVMKLKASRGGRKWFT
ncbi:Unknown protein [Striga hermonthica]|uniref:C2 NT-type domain-containing protein n=1 Tax=Striga hermonthica TaxID=68872 RepID=A0A9N7RH13_STRHE|nr:Unknown protein [Striga hermonthica]